MNDPYIGTQIALSSGATLTAVAVHHVKRSRKYYTWNCSACSKDPELWPAGSIVVCRYGVNRHCPCGCNKVGKYSEAQMLVRASRLARRVDAYFLGWAELYKGNTTKCFLLCEQHGTWATGRFNDLMQGKACPSCAKINRPLNRRLTLEYCESRARIGIAARGWGYHGLREIFKGGNTRIAVKCSEHGIFETTFHYANQGNMGCMKCALSGYGFDQTKAAVLYALRSECGGGILKLVLALTSSAEWRSLKIVRLLSFLYSGHGDPQAPKY